MNTLTQIRRGLVLSLPLALGLLGAASKASAQASEPAETVTIPFSFVANNQYVRAGSYAVQLQSEHVLMLRDLKTNRGQFLMVRPEQDKTIETRGRLIFKQDGGQAYLTQIRIPGSSRHSETVVHHKVNRDLAKVTPSKASDTFEIAMR